MELGIAEIKAEADSLLELDISSDVNIGDDRLQELARHELTSVINKRLYTSEKNRTQVMKDEIVNKHINNFSDWTQKKSKLLAKISLYKNKTNSTSDDLNKLVAKRDENVITKRKNFDSNYHLDDKKRSYEATKKRYEDMEVEMDGKPPASKKFYVYILSILAVGLVEWFINYSTFNIKYPVAIAAGVTILVAISIAIASHVNGAFLKQRVALFDYSVEKSERQQTIITQIIFTLLLILSLGIVTYSRYSILADQNVNAGLPGLPGEDAAASASIWLELAPFVVMNILVWLVGVAVSYFSHDSRPDYQEALKEYEKAKKTFNKCNKKLDEEIMQLDSKFDKDKRSCEKKADARNKETDTIDSLVSLLKEREAENKIKICQIINDLIGKYKWILHGAAHAQGVGDLNMGGGTQDLDMYHEDQIMFITTQEIKEKIQLTEDA